MIDEKQNEQKDELRDLDVPVEQAEAVRGGYTHVLEDAIIVSRKPKQGNVSAQWDIKSNPKV